MKLNNFLICCYLLVTALLFSSFFENIFVWLSFFANAVFLTVMLLYHLKIERAFSPFLSSYITFNYLFFILAPIIQIRSISDNSNLFPNAFPYSEGSIIYTNIIILVFHFILFFAYLFFKKKLLQKSNLEAYNKSKFLPVNTLIILIISVLTFILSYDYLENLIVHSNWISIKRYNLSVSKQLILKKVLYMLPLAGTILSLYYIRASKKINANWGLMVLMFVLLLIMLIVFINPLTEKRNAIGPIYITLIFLFFPKLLNSNTKSFLFLFFALVVFFPIVSALTHLDASLSEIIDQPSLIIDHYKEEGLIKTFNTLHYDAFANVAATIDYVRNVGLTYGYQLLSALLFFVPRSIWVSKPYSTGELIGDYLIEDYGFVYSNLSNPVVAEGYVNFGILGVIIMAIALPYFMVKFMIWLNSPNPLKKIMGFYFAIHLMFLLRGDFTNGFSYFVGTLIGVMVVPWLINKFSSFVFTKKVK